MAFIAVYDACVLHPAPLRDLLIRVGQRGIVRARWTEQILDECFASIVKARGINPARLVRTRELMNQAIADCLVTGYEELVEGLGLPDKDDRHVLAAAIRCGAQAIVTANLKDFPAEVLGEFNIEAIHPDDFLLYLIDQAPAQVSAAVSEQRAALKAPPYTMDQLLDTLGKQGLQRTVAKLRALGLGGSRR